MRVQNPTGAVYACEGATTVRPSCVLYKGKEIKTIKDSQMMHTRCGKSRFKVVCESLFLY